MIEPNFGGAGQFNKSITMTDSSYYCHTPLLLLAKVTRRLIFEPAVGLAMALPACKLWDDITGYVKSKMILPQRSRCGTTAVGGTLSFLGQRRLSSFVSRGNPAALIISRRSIGVNPVTANLFVTISSSVTI